MVRRAKKLDGIPGSRRRTPSVTFVPVKSPRRLVTIDGSWTEGDVRGAIVRLRPAPDATPEWAESQRLTLIEHGAAAVYVLPAPRSEAVPDEAVEAPAKATSARDAVLGLVAASNVEDRPALLALCEEIMAVNGL